VADKQAHGGDLVCRFLPRRRVVTTLAAKGGPRDHRTMFRGDHVVADRSTMGVELGEPGRAQACGDSGHGVGKGPADARCLTHEAFPTRFSPTKRLLSRGSATILGFFVFEGSDSRISAHGDGMNSFSPRVTRSLYDDPFPWAILNGQTVRENRNKE